MNDEPATPEEGQVNDDSAAAAERPETICEVEPAEDIHKCLWNRWYPGRHAVSCKACHRADDCREEVLGFTHCHSQLYSMDEHDFFQDVICIQAQNLLDDRFVDIVGNWTGTPIGYYVPVPDELRAEASERVIDAYGRAYSFILQPYAGRSPWDQERHTFCIAAAEAYTKFIRLVDGMIDRRQQAIMNTIATIAMSTFETREDHNEDCDHE